jgi:hypothetical protein
MVSRCQRPRAEKSLPASGQARFLLRESEGHDRATLSRPQHLPHSTFYAHRSIEWRLTTQFDSIKWIGEVRPCSPCHTTSNTACVPTSACLMGWSTPHPSLSRVRLTLSSSKKIETLYTQKKNVRANRWAPWSGVLGALSARFYISRFPNLPHVLTRNKHRKLLSTPARALSVSKYKLRRCSKC